MIAFMKRILCLCFALSFGTLRADEPSQLLDALRVEVSAVAKAESAKKEVKDESVNDGLIRRRRAEMVLSQIPAGEDALKDENIPRTLQILEQIQSVPVSEKAGEIGGKLVVALRDHVSKKQTALREKFDTVLRNALLTGLDARQAKQLDAPILDLARLRKETQSYMYRGDGYAITNTEALSSVEQILMSIQDLLMPDSQAAPKRGRDVKDRLQSFSGNYGRQLGDLMPRSEFLSKVKALSDVISPQQNWRVLDREEFEKRTLEIVSSVKKLEDLDPAVLKIDEMVAKQHDWNGYTNEGTIIYQIRNFRKVYLELQAGAATSVSFSMSSVRGSENVEVLLPLQSLLTKYALTRVLGTSGELAPTEGESVGTYLQRVLNSALKTEDWKLISKVLDSTQSLGLREVIDTSSMSALKLFLAGINMEKAKQFSGAVASYLGCLRTGAQIIPVERIGATLQELKKSHPQDYETGLQFAYTSSSSLYPGSLRGPAGFTTIPTSMLDRTYGPSQQDQRAVLPVPAANSAVKAPAKPAVQKSAAPQPSEQPQPKEEPKDTPKETVKPRAKE